jgi:hypothetical protein
MIDNTLNSLTHSSSDSRTQNPADILKILFQCVENCDVDKLNQILNGGGLKGKSLDTLLYKAFGVYGRNNHQGLEVINSLLR